MGHKEAGITGLTQLKINPIKQKSWLHKCLHWHRTGIEMCCWGGVKAGKDSRLYFGQLHQLGNHSLTGNHPKELIGNAVGNLPKY